MQRNAQIGFAINNTKQQENYASRYVQHLYSLFKVSVLIVCVCFCFLHILDTNCCPASSISRQFT